MGSGQHSPTLSNAAGAQWVALRAHILRVRKVKMAILNDMSSRVAPGRLTLLLGPPNAGKSTLLKAMAGKLDKHGIKARAACLLFSPIFCPCQAPPSYIARPYDKCHHLLCPVPAAKLQLQAAGLCKKFACGLACGAGFPVGVECCFCVVPGQARGRVTYNGRELREFLPERTAVYVEQEDQHMPELTVRETFNFSARCQGAGSNAGAPAPIFAAAAAAAADRVRNIGTGARRVVKKVACV
jgi:ABC-type transport system involved in cytochrome c biogenesis ATPase subunit